MNLKKFKLAELSEFEGNYNRHPDVQIEHLKRSLTDFSQVKNVVVWKGKVVCGNGLVMAARELGWDEIQAVDISDLTKKQAKALLIADNKTAEMALPDNDLLKDLLKDFDDPTDIPGITEELANLLNFDSETQADAEPQIDKAKELNEKWQVKTGDLFAIGNHRLLCGDCTLQADVDRLMNNETSELLFTSPPYADMRTYDGCDCSIEKLVKFIPAFYPHCNYQVVNLGLKRKDNEIVQYWDDYIKSAKDCGYKFLSWNVWDRGQAGGISTATAMFMITHEWMFVFGKDNKKLNRHIPNQTEKYAKRHGANWKDGHLHTVRESDDILYNKKSTAYEYHQLHSCVQITAEKSDARKWHTALFPVTLPTEYIKAMTDENDIVAEPFCGSGTTMVASENLKRRCFGMEISENYCAVILERMQTAFPDIKIERLD